MSAVLWLNIPLMIVFFALWVAIPAWLVLKRPDRRPRRAPAPAPSASAASASSSSASASSSSVPAVRQSGSIGSLRVGAVAHRPR